MAPPARRGGAVALLCAAAAAASTARPRVVGWYATYDNYPKWFPVSAIDFDVVTHIVAGGPSLAEDGSVSCDPSQMFKDPVMKELHAAVRKHGAKIQFSMGSEAGDLIAKKAYRSRFLATVRSAVEACDFDGIEFDYEGPGSPAEADAFTTLLIDIKAAMGADKVISADSEPPQWSDYYRLNASKMDGKNIDFVNYMSYFDGSASGDIGRWRDSIEMLVGAGYPRSTIHLAVPYYSGNSAWGDLCGACPNISAASNKCGDTWVVGKQMNEDIGHLVRTSGIGGVFPWMLNYDTVTTCGDDSLFKWLRKGLLAAPGSTPVPTPAPPPDPATPHLIPGGSVPNPYIYDSRRAAEGACTQAGFKGLCRKEELRGHEACQACWCSDFEGYWMAEDSAGCGSAGYNGWSGPASACCCNA